MGDIAAGVDAWTQRASELDTRPGSSDSPGDRPRTRRAKTSGRGRARSGPRRELTDEEFAAKEARAVARAERREVRERAEADPEEKARTIILDQLTGAARSRADLRKKLDAKEIPEEVSERLLDRFTELGLVNDRAFAENWAVGRQQAKGLAPRAIAQELRRKGIDDSLAKDALDLLDVDSQREAAEALVAKRIRSLRRVDRTTATRRLVSMLARKGYGGDIAWPVVNEALDGANFDGDRIEFDD